MTNQATGGGWSDKQVFTTGEAAQICNVSQQTIIRCFDNGRLTGFRVPGSKFRRIPRDELLRFMRANGIPLEALEGDLKRVLVVDDDENIASLFSEVLSEDGRYEIRTATTGYDAGLLTANFKPHLILLDYMLPDINGDIVIDRVRSLPGGKDTKILIISGVVNRDEIAHLLREGADGFIKKPVDLDELLGRMASLLGLEAKA